MRQAIPWSTANTSLAVGGFGLHCHPPLATGNSARDDSAIRGRGGCAGQFPQGDALYAVTDEEFQEALKHGGSGDALDLGVYGQHVQLILLKQRQDVNVVDIVRDAVATDQFIICGECTGNLRLGTENKVDRIVVKKKNGKNIWVDDNKEVYKLEGAKYAFVSAADEDMQGLKNAGVKTKNKELMVENLKFSPNPGDGKFNLSFTLRETKKVTINIYDINGNMVYTETLKDFQGDYNKQIDISQQPGGTFFLQIIQGLYDIIKKIIIQ